jgi:hypothetical protein
MLWQHLCNLHEKVNIEVSQEQNKRVFRENLKTENDIGRYYQTSDRGRSLQE